jgi:CHAT domain-containing protein
LETGPSLNWQQLSDHDLQVFGRWLLPSIISRELTPHTHLIIAPHDRLHGLPWAALAVGGAKQPLVECCIPTIIPSLQSLGLLWERPPSPAVPRAAGLVVAAADFQGRRSPLPQALAEGHRLAAQLAPGGAHLLGQAATWPRMKELAGKDGLARFSFLHFAGHAFHDQVNGRLSGFSLHDRDVWLDEFWVLTPAPALVSLSACSGIQSRVYPGDEHVSLAVTCLAAGARHVIGSLWPVRDDDAMALMVEFYHYFLAGSSPAKALALAQRALAGQGLSTLRWGTFCCLGVP